MDKIKKSILSLKTLRSGIPQLLFLNSIYYDSVIVVRSSVLEFKEENPSCKEIDFIINSPGGLADDAYRIIRTLRKNFEIVNIIVPFWAKSAATLLSLGGSKIIMDEFGEFGPLDAQLGKPRDDSPEYERESALNDEQTITIIESHYKQMYESIFLQIYEHDRINIPKNELSSQLLNHLSKFYDPLLRQIDPYKLGDKRRKLDIAVEYANRILIEYGGLEGKEQRTNLVNFLVDGCPDHGYVIDFDLIKLFYPNVFTGECFGDDYKRELSKLSNLLIKNTDQENTYVGFITEEYKEGDDDKSQNNK